MLDALEPVLVIMLRRVIRACKWGFILAFYSTVFFVGEVLSFLFGTARRASLPGAGPPPQVTHIGPIFLAPFGFLMAVAIVALLWDRTRENGGKDDFWGDRLFHRYGQRVANTVLPIPVQREWTAKETAGFTHTLQLGLARRLSQRLAGTEVQVISKQAITDRSSGEVKQFVRLVVRTRYGSNLTHFVHYASFGDTITAHYFTFVRGRCGFLDVCEFILLSPFTIWFWIIPWMLNLYSLVARLSVFRDSSFDSIDLDTMGTMTWTLMGEETRDMLSAAGLLTDEMKQVLNYHFNEIKISNVSGSVKLDNVAQAVSRRMRQSLGG